MGRPPCCDRSNVKKGLWTAEEDAKILAYVSNYGVGNWTLVPKKAGLNRCGKSCRLRWTNYLRPDLKHDSFTSQEEELIINLHEAIGSRWSIIAKQLPGRTDNDVKNYWNTKLRKKLRKMGIDPVTHKPFSQVLTEFGNISDIPGTGNQIISLSKRLSNDVMSKPGDSPAIAWRSSSTRPVIEDNTPTISNPQFQYQFETLLKYYCSEVGSSCSSPSSTSLTQSSCTHIPTSPPSWREFLLSDPTLPSDEQNPDLQGFFSSSNISTLTGKDDQYFQGEHNRDFASSHPSVCLASASSSSPTSFVDDILDKDREMQLQFPQLLDPSCDY
ncbi:hypothetical protein K2173_020253 [Erythroxylum novogranatense]|uniref:Uncharacterized protein n=1 Tax=Erythroxylum novogranatense TaxID=1862640 RepID=A0AAV8UAR2_9ROSI|nr:hypothetical protein K2173_020253 [Erythroxylum novogranatense]